MHSRHVRRSFVQRTFILARTLRLSPALRKLQKLQKQWVIILVALHVVLNLCGIHPFSDIQIEHDVRGSELRFWRCRHLIFCVSPGRSGSKYLQAVLSTARNVYARHEPYPQMNGAILRQVVLEGRRSETLQNRTEMKLSAIRRVLEGALPNVVYAETSHMFIKTFADVILENLGDYPKISIIILHRPIKEILLSQLLLGWFSSNHSGRNVWYYDPRLNHRSEQTVPLSNATGTALNALGAYNADIHIRTSRLRALIKEKRQSGQWKQVQIHDVRLADIMPHSPNSVSRFLRRVGLAVDRSKLSLLQNRDLNSRDIKKDRAGIAASMADITRYLPSLLMSFPELRDRNPDED